MLTLSDDSFKKKRHSCYRLTGNEGDISPGELGKICMDVSGKHIVCKGFPEEAEDEEYFKCPYL